MKFDIKHILIFGLALGMTSCVETMKDGDMSTGFLGIPVLDADIQVEEFGATKAAPSLPTLSVPNTSALHFKVTGSDSKVVWDQDGLWSTPLQMPVGEYTIEVNYGSNTYGNPWYTGTCTGTISAVTEAVPAIGMSLCNSLLAVVLADDLTQHFTPSEGECVTISSTSGNSENSENSENIKSITTTLGNYVFVPAGEDLTIEVRGKSSAGIDKTLSWTLTQLSPATATYVTCSLTTTNAPTITLSGTPEAWGTVGYIPVATTANISEANVAKMVYIAEDADNPSSPIQGTVEGTGTEVVFKNLTPGKSYSVYATIGALKSNQVEMTVATPEISINTGANHTTNSSSELDGTDFTASISIPEKFKGVVANVNLTLSDGNKVLREKTLSASETVWTSDGSVETAWPYLPHGNYTLTGTVSYNNGTKDAGLTELTLPVGAPSFTVNKPSAHTSYDTYLASGAAAANNEDGATIYGIANNGVKISSNILNNDNYKSLIGGYTYFIDEKQVYEVNQANQTWGSHEIKAKYTFDEVTAESDPLTCHVTGLPYKIDFKSSIDRWELNKAEKVSGGLKMNPYTSTATLTFHLPSTISTLVTIFQGSTLYGTKSFIWLNLTIGSTKTEKFLTQSKSSITAHTETIGTDKSISGTLSANNNSVILENPSDIASYNVVVPGLRIVYN